MKKRVENEKFKHHYGSKPAGAEAMIYIFIQIRQSPKLKLWHFSADAIKAFYNLNRDLALEVFNLFMDKYNGSSNAFCFGLTQGVAQSEGGSPGAPDMSFVENV